MLSSAIASNDMEQYLSISLPTNVQKNSSSSLLTSSKKDQYIQNQLKQRRSNFIENHKFKIAIGTWNVNSKLPNIFGKKKQVTTTTTPNTPNNLSSSSSTPPQPSGGSSSSSKRNLLSTLSRSSTDDLTESLIDQATISASQMIQPILTSNLTDLEQDKILHIDPIDEWLHLNEQPDIIAIGLQEIDMTAEAMLKKETQSKLEWIQVLESELQCSSKSKYIRLADKQLVGMFCCLFINEKFHSQVRDVQAVSLALGAMGVMGNKGAVGIRLKVAETTMCFVTTHLAPHQGAIQKRNQNFMDIFTQLEFAKIENENNSSTLTINLNSPTTATNNSNTSNNSSNNSSGNLLSGNSNNNEISSPLQGLNQSIMGQSMLPDQHDYFFWFGDLNYRIDNLERNQVEEYVVQEQYKSLLEYDQLTVEKMSGRVFMGFKEGRITFPPTYKYDPGTLTFDTSEKRRIPSYTDRILWKGVKRDSVKQLCYQTHLNLLMSDHLPVSSIFETDVQIEVEHKFRQTRESIAREYEQLFPKTPQISTNQFINSLPSNEPTIQLSANEIHFENAKFGVPQSVTLLVKNVGSVVSEFFFTKKGLDEKICQDWLTISSIRRLLIPGETLEIEFICCFNANSAAQFNLMDTQKPLIFEDNLLIHVDNGKDHPIRVYGNYLKSCFGNSLDNLVECFTSVRDPKCKTVQYYDENDNLIERLFIPKELFFLCDHIVKYGIREEGLFQVQGVTDQIRTCRELLDNGMSLSKHFTSGSIHSVCSCLIQFFESLVDPIIPPKLYRVLMEQWFNPDSCRELIENNLSPTHYNVWHYVMNFLREVLMNSDANGLSPDSLAQGFADVLLRSPKHMSMEMKKKQLKGKIQIIKHFFTKEYNQSMVAKEEETIFK
ncbi:phosphatidylinositol polyphosphate 5-phosphatase [Naegleria gruberi]|uniref:Phosphatidylinositol polyphosphate 5-phosphatase n=1 Tax=Naegleria gruberi TaxID=5762 RepID=D2VEM1_NAEGR|nr:phosphatidylinositol polyphosphate 5-phosphatase [Naegleria gruberi]EFC44909.1 phosphatidylinositol polyphosphate 5-phosphatase [Naegleria gruberi]|eukprot:XP_002677653.1 phosphatidylinositol polyphosphate 5-phosphatase [Naegleria gruberi strain NEG-M]